MEKLSTQYMGLSLKNPLVVGASPHTSTPERIKELENAGAGAIVVKTLYEEQIEMESFELASELNEYTERNAEMITLFPNVKHAGSKKHLLLLKNAREKVEIPLIASLNAVAHDTWVEYAQQIATTGVDALELNLYAVPTSFDADEQTIIEEQLKVLGAVAKTVSIPISVKISPYYTNPLWVIKQMDSLNIKAFVLFNKLFQPDINIDSETMQQSIMVSSSNDSRLAIRFAGLLHGNINASIASSGGIITADDAIKSILAGADVFQVTSLLFKEGPDGIVKMLNGINKWMDSKGYQNLSDFRGKLSRKNIKKPFAYQRAQYVEAMMNPEGILNRTTLP